MKERKNNPDKIGFVKFWGWQTRGVAASGVYFAFLYGCAWNERCTYRNAFNGK